MDDLISRQAAVDALENDKASLDHIIRGMSAYDVRLDAYVSQRNQVDCDIDTINSLPSAQLGTDLAEVGTDMISRAAAIDALRAMQTYKLFAGDDMLLIDQAGAQTELLLLPPAQPEQLGTNLAEVGADCISRQAAIDAVKRLSLGETDATRLAMRIGDYLERLPSAQPETAKRIVGKSRDGMTLWYQCDTCNEPVDAQDNYCRGCGRRLTDG
jgi:hypothetical protein